MEFPQCVPVLYYNEYYSLYVQYPYLFISDLAQRGVKLDVSQTTATLEDVDTYTVRLLNQRKQYRVYTYFKHELHELLVYYNILYQQMTIESAPTTFMCVLKQYITQVKIYKNVYQVTAMLGQYLALRANSVFLQFPYTAIDKISQPDVDTLKFVFLSTDVVLQFSNKYILFQFLQFLQGQTLLARYIYNQLKTGSHLVKTPNQQLRSQITDIGEEKSERIYVKEVDKKMEVVRGKIERLGRMAAAQQYALQEENPYVLQKTFDADNAGKRARYERRDSRHVAHLLSTLELYYYDQAHAQEQSSNQANFQAETSGSGEFDDLGADMSYKELYHRQDDIYRDRQIEQLNVDSGAQHEHEYENAKRALGIAIEAIKRTAQPTERQLLELYNLKSIKSQFGRVSYERLVQQIYQTLANFAEEISDDHNAFGSENSEICEPSINLGDYAVQQQYLQGDVGKLQHKLASLRDKLAGYYSAEKRQKTQASIAQFEEKLAAVQEELQRLQQLYIEQTSSESIICFAISTLEAWKQYQAENEKQGEATSNAALEQIETFRQFLSKLTQAKIDYLYELLDTREATYQQLCKYMAIDKNMHAKLKATDDLQAQDHMKRYKEHRREHVRLERQIAQHKDAIEFIEQVMAGQIGHAKHTEPEPEPYEVPETREEACKRCKKLLETPRLVAMYIAGIFVKCQMNCSVDGDAITCALTQLGSKGCCAAQFNTEFVLASISCDDYFVKSKFPEALVAIQRFKSSGNEEFYKRLKAARSTALNYKKPTEIIDGYYFRVQAVLRGDAEPHLVLLDKDYGGEVCAALRECLDSTR